ncbi:MAG: carotenoid biosynthesis protein [Chitinophagaceae bacterium]|nr:carotenoid biosynthesis protein [Chitinophagaceae bacterium]
MKWKRQHIAIFIALLVHTSGLIGILFTPYRNWFIRYTPLNLVLMAFLLAWNQRSRVRAFYIFFAIAALAGFLAEWIGINTSLLFGSYRYGDMLGPAFGGVPLLIGLNWFLVVFCSGSIMHQVQDCMRSKPNGASAMPPRLAAWSVVLDGALLAVLFDWIMEPAAMQLGFWEWKGGTVPFYNYVCWLLISTGLLVVFRLFSFRGSNHFAVHLFIIELFFFLVLRIYL